MDLLCDELVDPQKVYHSPEGYRVDILSFRGSEDTTLFDLLVSAAKVHSGTYRSAQIRVMDPTIVLDFDVEQSLLRQESGGPLWKIRPVILPEIYRDEIGDRIRTPMDISGQVLDHDLEKGFLDLELPDGRGHVEVSFDEETLVLDSLFQPTTCKDIHPGDTANVRGYLDGSGQIESQSIVLGEIVQMVGRVQNRYALVE